MKGTISFIPLTRTKLKLNQYLPYKSLIVFGTQPIKASVDMLKMGVLLDGLEDSMFDGFCDRRLKN